MKHCLVLFLMLCLSVQAGAEGAEWPGWRGPSGTGVSDESGWNPLKCPEIARQVTNLGQGGLYEEVASSGALSAGIHSTERRRGDSAEVPLLRRRHPGGLSGGQWPAQSCLFSTIVGRMVGDGLTDNVLAGKAKFTDPAFVAALAFYATLFTDGVINRTDMTIGYGDGPGIFASGKAAMFVDGDWRTGAYLTDKSTSTWGALCRRRLSNAPNMLCRGLVDPAHRRAATH